MAFFLSLLALLMVSIAAPAAAQSCGDTLSQDTTLRADLNCPGYPYALRIDTQGVALDLSGFTISGADAGVFIDHVDDVKISGPGRILGNDCRLMGWASLSHSGVQAINADRLIVSGVDFAQLNTAVAMQGVSFAHIEGNVVEETMYGFVVWDALARGRPGANNQILNNRVTGSPACGFVGVLIEGDNAYGNLVYGNHLEFMYTGVQVAASGNDIASNTLSGRASSPGSLTRPQDAGVEIAAGFDNRIVGNMIRKVSFGVYISPVHVNSRTLNLSVDAAGNEVIANRIDAFLSGVRLGNGGHQTGGKAYRNRIGDNQIVRALVGLEFDANAHDNNGVGNGYRAVGTTVVDNGTGNQWP